MGIQGRGKNVSVLNDLIALGRVHNVRLNDRINGTSIDVQLFK